MRNTFSPKMATKNCPKCESPNPVACKKCACGHVFFTTRRSANALADFEDYSELNTHQELEVPRRRTARVTRERPQFYDALQVENQTRRQRELQKRRKASKSEEVEPPPEEIPEKPTTSSSTKRHIVESPPLKIVEPPRKKRRGRPPGLTNRKSGRAQILATKTNDSNTKPADGMDNGAEDEELVKHIHEIPAAKALQMNMVLADINSRISSSSVRAEEHFPRVIPKEESSVNKETNSEGKETTLKVEIKTETKEQIDPIASPKIKAKSVKIPECDVGSKDAGTVEIEIKAKPTANVGAEDNLASEAKTGINTKAFVDVGEENKSTSSDDDVETSAKAVTTVKTEVECDSIENDSELDKSSTEQEGRQKLQKKTKYLSLAKIMKGEPLSDSDGDEEYEDLNFMNMQQGKINENNRKDGANGNEKSKPVDTFNRCAFVC